MFTNNKLCQLLKIEFPLLQGGMARIAGGKLAAAVSNAGGLGVIGAGGADVTWLKQEIHRARQITDRPFGVNLMLAAPGVDELIKLVVAEQVPVVTTGGGNPGRYIELFKQSGVTVIPVVASLALAKRLTRLGADAIIAEGMESGGHIGEMTTMCLIPAVVDAVDVPVIAAGGIADGRGFLAAMALGAQGIQMGTRFVCAHECDVHPAYQDKILRARDRATVICGQSTNHPVRAIHNRFTHEYLQTEFHGAAPQDLEKLGKGRYPDAALNGNVEQGTILAGQVSCLVNKVEDAASIVTNIINDFMKVKKRMEDLTCHE